MNDEAINTLIEKKPALASARSKLESFAPGNYCLHRSWGFGKIVDYDEAENKLVIDFEEGKQGHAMDPAFCVDKLEVLPENDILVRSRTEKETVDDMVKNRPVELMCELLATAEGQSMTESEIDRVLSRVVGADKFRKWWTATKKKLAKDPRVAVPQKKTDPYVLRDEPVKPEEEILEQFHATRNPKEKIQLGEKLYEMSENISVIREELPEILHELTDAIKNAKTLSMADRLYGVWVRNNLARDLHEDVESLEPSSSEILEQADDTSELADQLPPQYYKRYLDLISRTFPDKWQQILEDLLRNAAGRFATECVNFMIENDMKERVRECLTRWLNEQTMKGPLLYWIVKNRNSRKYSDLLQPMITPRLLNAMFYAIDYEALQNASAKRIALADILSDDQELIPDLLSGADAETARDLAQTLLLNQGFGELTKKSLLARFIKQYPNIQSLVAGEETESSGEDEALVVSQESLDKVKEEYEDLVSRKIPENKEAIAAAREHGDLKENAEYKMARQDQDTLLARKSQLEVDLNRARVTDFSDAPTEKVGVGSVVGLRDGSTGKTQRYAILGAWDSDPENNILSYRTPLAQSLLGCQVGETVTTEIAGNEVAWSVLDIGRWVDDKSAASA